MNLSRLNLAGTMLGPVQGVQLEERLRLDSLSVNADAFASAAAETEASPTPDDPTTFYSAQLAPRQEGQRQQREPGSARRNSNSAEPGRKCVSRPASVPDHRLPEIRDKVCMYIRRDGQARGAASVEDTGTTGRRGNRHWESLHS